MDASSKSLPKRGVAEARQRTGVGQRLLKCQEELGLFPTNHQLPVCHCQREELPKDESALMSVGGGGGGGLLVSIFGITGPAPAPAGGPLLPSRLSAT